VSSVPEEIERSTVGEVLAHDAERGLRIEPEGRDVEREDLVEASITEVGILERDPL